MAWAITAKGDTTSRPRLRPERHHTGHPLLFGRYQRECVAKPGSFLRLDRIWSIAQFSAVPRCIDKHVWQNYAARTPGACPKLSVARCSKRGERAGVNAPPLVTAAHTERVSSTLRWGVLKVTGWPRACSITTSMGRAATGAAWEDHGMNKIAIAAIALVAMNGTAPAGAPKLGLSDPKPMANARMRLPGDSPKKRLRSTRQAASSILSRRKYR
jgi:hypothetical protein